uniref:Uncharacterized protein n=1 Tax=Rhinopithecus bieti TaxID=61621 RepID=A0A2K6MCT8_RHIBE
MVFLPPLGEAPRQAERRFRGSWPEGAASAPGRARGGCLWPPRGDFERLSRSWTEWGGPGEHSRGPALGPTANFCLPACLPPPFHPDLTLAVALSLDIRGEGVGSHSWF